MSTLQIGDKVQYNGVNTTPLSPAKGIIISLKTFTYSNRILATINWEEPNKNTPEQVMTSNLKKLK